ncbi:hypothetical protein MtrunA17_Chr2g0317531 [Medicago truncatula]|uniref:Transmembrane protein n=1 Tax=Medicago truncatula TaxID=3880 RepID=A0A396JCT1_MEDTR|nr:hypothetical protein MtrunA17_Chr2g0317531 [Medicago truncatula]
MKRRDYLLLIRFVLSLSPFVPSSFRSGLFFSLASLVRFVWSFYCSGLFCFSQIRFGFDTFVMC